MVQEQQTFVGIGLWAVVADTAGAHEAECVYSVWTAPLYAIEEVDRLEAEGISAGCYGGRFYVAKINADTPSNEWIS